MGIGYTKISKQAFYKDGGFSNPRYFRVTRSGKWAYYSRS